MKRFLAFLWAAALALALAGCAPAAPPAQVAATTLPVYEFTTRLCAGTGITVSRLVTDQVSCLHDYSLNVRQVKAVEGAETIVISGAGLEAFMEDLLHGRQVIDASQGIELLCSEGGHHEGEEESAHEGHHHEFDPHIWLSPAIAKVMAQNICAGLSAQYPRQEAQFRANLDHLSSDLDDLQSCGEDALRDLSCRDLITFHDGFSYFAQAFGLNIVEAVEEESGSEASARELIQLIGTVREHDLPAVFTERSGSTSAASIIARETGAGLYSLDMAMAGDSYFDAMIHNISILKEALK